MNKTLSLEGMLKRIIEKQDGKFHKYIDFMERNAFKISHGYLMRNDGVSAHILEILLDSEGLKSSHKGWMCEDCGNGSYGRCYDNSCPFNVEAFRECGHQILDSWLTGGHEAAILTSYELL